MKLLFTDLDGTLLNDDKKISPVTGAFLRDWTNEGNLLIPSSGRPPASIEEVLKQNDVSSKGLSICAFNGGLLYDYENGRIIHECRIPYEFVEPVCKLTRELKLHIHTYENNCIYSEHQSDELSYYQRFIHLPAHIVTSLASALQNSPFKLIAISFDHTERLEQLRHEILNRYYGVLDCFYSNPNYLEILSCHSGKGSAVLAAANFFSVSLSDTYAFGDEENDISMITTAGHGYAMCNGSDKTKKSTSNCTEYDNNHDGIAHCMKPFL